MKYGLLLHDRNGHLRKTRSSKSLCDIVGRMIIEQFSSIVVPTI